MKTKNLFKQISLLLAAFLLFAQGLKAQEITQQRITVRKGIPETPVVDIKVFNTPDGTYNLLAYNPTEHSLAVYDNDRFSVTWLNEHSTAIGSSAIITGVCGSFFQVLVLDKQTGTLGNARIYGLDCLPEDRTEPVSIRKIHF